MLDLDKVIYDLISLVENKFELLEEIYSLTKCQTEVIEDVDMELLSELIDRKQEKIDLIRKSDLQFEAIVSDIKILYGVNSLDELELQNLNIVILKDNIAKVVDILNQIVQIESINKEKINTKREELKLKMNNAKNGKKAIRQYGDINNYTDAYFFDKKIK